MDHDRFDRLSKRVAAWPLSRRRAVRALGAAGLAGALLGLRRERVAADCADITLCAHACGEPDPVLGLRDLCTITIPGGPYGTCWSWDIANPGCHPCGRTRAALNALCNSSYPECGGTCIAG